MKNSRIDKVSDRQLRELLGLLDLANMLIRDPEDRITYWSAGCEDLYGFTSEQALGRVSHELLQSRFFEPLEKIREIMSRDGRWEGELIHRRKDGRTVAVAAVWVPYHDSDGQLQAVLESCTDITERYASQAEHAWLASIVDSSDDAIISMDLNGTILTWNAAAQHTFGYEADEVIGLSITLLLPPERVQEETYILDCVRRGEHVKHFETVRVAKDGSRLDISVTVSPLKDRSGRIIGASKIARDITERKRAEAAIRAAHSKAEEGRRILEAMMEHIPMGIAIADAPDVTIRQVSRYGLELGGQSREQDQSASLDAQVKRWKIFRPDGVTPARPEDLPLSRATRKGEVIREEEWVLLENGDSVRIPILCTAAPICDPENNVLGGVMGWQDISARKRMEQELRAAKLSADRAKTAAEEASRAKDRFLAVLSHELRTPLTPVLAAISMMERQSVPEKDIRQMLQLIRRNVELEARLIDDLLDLTRIATGKVVLKKSRIELQTVIKRAVEVCEPDMKSRGLHFGMDLEPNPCFVEGDAARLEQVFWNLLKNAIKFTPEGGCLGVRCRADGNGSVIVEVADSGIGIDPADLERIFDAFEQAENSTARQFGGLGLGLAISKSLVRMHDGAIWARSAGKGQGASFMVQVPILTRSRRRAEANGPNEAAAETSPGGRRPLSVLLVEDHADTADMMKHLLEISGHQVETAADIATALEMANRHHFDLLISDLGLPDGTGHDLLRQLRRQGHRKLAAIAISGYGQERDLEQSRRAGFTAHLTKPVDADRLLDEMDNAVSTRSHS